MFTPEQETCTVPTSSNDFADLWADLPASERLPIILAHFAPDAWFGVDALPTLACFRTTPAGRWGQIKARFKALGGNPFDLQQAVDDLLVAQRAQAQAHGEQTPCLTPARFTVLTAQALLALDLPPQHWVIPDLLPAGCTLFTGRGKDGKSLLMLNLCVAVATGGIALNHVRVPAGDVLYLALEDGERRAQARLRAQLQHCGLTEAPARLDFVLWDAPRVGQGFEEALTAWLDDHAAARLVVIDILEKIRPPRPRGGSVYADDYAALATLQRLAQQRNVAIVVVHHSNKLRAEDVRDTASGSMGLIAACDTFWSLQRRAGQADAVLHVTGRDVESQALALRFADGFWSVLGDAETVRRSQASQDVLTALIQAGQPLTPKELATLLAVEPGTIRVRLCRMVERGEVVAVGGNRYTACHGVTGVTVGTSNTPAPAPHSAEAVPAVSAAACEMPEAVTGVTDVTPLHTTDEACRCCGSQGWWRNADGQAVCGVCHPPAVPGQDDSLSRT